MPRKNNEKYQRKYCKLIMDHFRRGGTVTTLPIYLEEFHGIDVCRATIYNWAEQHPEFKKRLEKGKELVQMELEYLLRSDSIGKIPKGVKKINIKSVQFSLKTRFHKDFGTKSAVKDQPEEKSIPQINIIRAKQDDD